MQCLQSHCELSRHADRPTTQIVPVHNERQGNSSPIVLVRTTEHSGHECRGATQAPTGLNPSTAPHPVKMVELMSMPMSGMQPQRQPWLQVFETRGTITPTLSIK